MLLNHYIYLDLIRYFAAMFVAISHFKIYNSEPSYEFISILSVEIFFVLSGFVLAKQINIIFISNNFKNFKIFLYRRWLRTIPAYLIAIIIASIIFEIGNLNNFIKYLFYIQNFSFDNIHYNFFPVGWSLSVEEWFYLFFPLSFLFYKKVLNIKNNELYFVIFFILFFTLLRFSYNQYDDWGSEIRRTVIFRLDSIAYGYLAFMIKDKISFNRFYYLYILSIVSFVFLFFSKNYLKDYFLIQNLYFLICGIFFSLLIITLSKYKLSNSLIVILFNNLAKMSYSIYLFHIIIISILDNLNLSNNLFIYFIALNIFSLSFYYLFENRILKLRPTYIR